MICSVLLVALCSVADLYDFTATVQVPRVYDNSESMGYRKNQTQTLRGKMVILYGENPSLESGWNRPAVSFLWLTNQTHKINNRKIGYSCTVNNDGCSLDGPMTRVNAIGDNKRDVFTTPDIVFYLDAEPDYSIGEDDEDNSLLVTLSGTGSMSTVSVYGYEEVWHGSGKRAYSTKKRVLLRKYKRIKSLNGKVAGTLGCGCRAYGHKSPTRVMGPYGATCSVDDVAKVQGTWTAAFDQRVIIEEDK